MIKKKLWFAGMLSIILVFVLVFSSCPTEETTGGSDETNVATPVITAQTGIKRYLTGMTTNPLSVTATASDGGALTYHWYQVDEPVNAGGTAIPDQTGATYQPATDAEGTSYYYVVVINPAAHSLDASETISDPMTAVVIDALPAADATVTITANQRQYVRGFGGMSNAFDYNPPASGGMPRFMEMRDIETMFGPDGLGFKMLRIMIYPYPLSEVVSGQVEPQMSHTSTYINAVKKVNEYGGYVLASPWTAPAHMKTNESTLAGGHLKPTMFADYAQYLRTFANDMAGRGAPIYAISIQNEPSLTVSYDGMEWTAAEHRDFLKNNGNFTRAPSAIKGWGGGKEQPFVKIVGGEAHQIGTWYDGAMRAVIADPAAHENMDLVAYHVYGGLGDRNSVTINGTLNRETWMTEYNINSQNDPGYYDDSTWDFAWRFAEYIYHVIGVNDSGAFVWWYLKRFYGAVGDGSYGTVNGQVMPRGYILSHYAKYATDTVRVEASTTHPGGSSNIRLLAFQRKTDKTNPVELQVMESEDSYSVVIYDQRISATGETSLRINLPAGFEASAAYGIISDSTGNRHKAADVYLNPDGASADVTLPANAIVSVKLVK